MAGCILSIRFLNIQYPFPVWHLNEDLFLDACTLDQTRQIRYKKGRSGCGTVVRAISSHEFESSHRHNKSISSCIPNSATICYTKYPYVIHHSAFKSALYVEIGKGAAKNTLLLL